MSRSLDLFRMGYRTDEVAAHMGVTEAQAEWAIHEARAEERVANHTWRRDNGKKLDALLAGGLGR